MGLASTEPLRWLATATEEFLKLEIAG